MSHLSRLVRLTCALLTAIAAFADPVVSQERADPLEAIAMADKICAEDAESFACAVATDRSAALVADVVAEAGNTRDRGAFIDLVRVLLTDVSPEIRTSAVYALGKLQPDSADTSVLRALLRDPVSNVRAGAWAAAFMSADPVAKAMARRVKERPSSDGYGPDPAPFDPAQLGFDLPPGAEYLWLTAATRATGQLQFLTTAPVDQTIAHFTAVAGSAPLPIADVRAARAEASSVLIDFFDPQIFGDAQVVRLGEASATLPLRFAVVYKDLVFGQTGFAIVFADSRNLEPTVVALSDIISPTGSPLNGADFRAAMLRRSGFKPEADPDQSDLFMSIVAASGVGAADYLEIYPEGAYAVEARAILAAPRLTLDALSYAEGSDPRISFLNLPEGSSATVGIMSVSNDYAWVAGIYVPDTSAAETEIQTHGNLTPGVYLLQATVKPGDGSEESSLSRDFSVERGEATLAVDRPEYAPGEVITIRFSGMSGDDQDYLSTAEIGSPNASYLQYVYTQSAREGTATLIAPSTPGSYEIRAFFREDESELRGSVAFTVAGSAAPVATPPDAATVIPPAGPADEARASLMLDKSEYAPGEAIIVTFAGMSGDSQDYVSTAPVGASNATYLTYAYTNAAVDGTVTLVGPTNAGAYEVRAFFREDETILRGSIPFTIAGAATPAPGEPSFEARATLSLNKTTFAPGETITITYSGMFGDPSDYISTAEAGSSNMSFLQYVYTEGAEVGTATLIAPIKPGSYEVRAFYKEDETILRAKVPFTVQ
ncbi:hypothetical protein [Tabrizicola sp.]|uniref:HEAT repeat domain-containing protein n=1 Tax=Tabrizicola sp. TaxID=2005166 RepID=UPI00286CD738|nr:hypothetical protein [Tabrizicola sp.]